LAANQATDGESVVVVTQVVDYSLREFGWDLRCHEREVEGA
jgi:hypothetical protein